jgi:hypothetical protein
VSCFEVTDGSGLVTVMSTVHCAHPDEKAQANKIIEPKNKLNNLFGIKKSPFRPVFYRKH